MDVTPTAQPKPETNEEAGILSLILIQLAKLTEMFEQAFGVSAEDATDEDA